MRVGLDWVTPSKSYGLAYGYSFLRDHAADLELGKSLLGHFIAARYRADFEFENTRTLFYSLAVGPQLALKNHALGLVEKPPAKVPGVTTNVNGPTSFHHLAVGGEAAVGAFVWHGLHVRVSLTVLYRLDSNLAGFCRDPRYREDESCPQASYDAEDTLTGMLRLGAGYAW
jgi:hypothetical protein